jgi:N-acetylglutamate synthase-like GNAT family acetyltransferase
VFGNQMGRLIHFREHGFERIDASNWPEEGLGQLQRQFRNSGSA